MSMDRIQYDLLQKGINSYAWHVSKNYACAIINGDYSGLEETDIKILNSFMDQLPSDIAHFDCNDTYSENFTRCEICNLQSDCMVLIGIIKESKI